MEDQIRTNVIVKVSFVDLLKLLFGGCLNIQISSYANLDIVDNKPVITGINSAIKLKVETDTVYFTKCNKASYGYAPKRKDS